MAIMSAYRNSIERQVLRDFDGLLSDESRVLRSYKIKYWSLGGVGIAMTLGAVVTALLWHRDAFPYCAVAGIGGLLAGCSNIYCAAYTQWPAVKRYIDVNAVRRDLDDLDNEDAGTIKH